MLRPVGPGHAFCQPSTPNEKGTTRPPARIRVFHVLRRKAKWTFVGQSGKNHHTQRRTSTTVYFQTDARYSNPFARGEPSERSPVSASGQLTDRCGISLVMLACFCGNARVVASYFDFDIETPSKTPPRQERARSSVSPASGSSTFLTLYLGLGAMTSGNARCERQVTWAAPLLAPWNEPIGLFAINFRDRVPRPFPLATGQRFDSRQQRRPFAHDLSAACSANRVQPRLNQVQWRKLPPVRRPERIAIVLGSGSKTSTSVTSSMGVQYAAKPRTSALVIAGCFGNARTEPGSSLSVVIGMFSSLGWILLSAFRHVSTKSIGIDPAMSPIPFSQPGQSGGPIPLSLLTLILVFTQMTGKTKSHTARI